jgi:hypothetical protein
MRRVFELIFTLCIRGIRRIKLYTVHTYTENTLSESVKNRPNARKIEHFGEIENKIINILGN